MAFLANFTRPASIMAPNFTKFYKNTLFFTVFMAMAQILCYKKSGIHWYHCNPTFLWKINFTLVRRLISALIWDISGLWNRSDGRDFREKRIVISRFLTPYIQIWFIKKFHQTTKLLFSGFTDKEREISQNAILSQQKISNSQNDIDEEDIEDAGPGIIFFDFFIA